MKAKLLVNWIMLAGLILSDLTKSSHSRVCNFTGDGKNLNLAESLFKRMFPSNIIKVEDMATPKKMANSTCFIVQDNVDPEDYFSNPSVTVTANANYLKININDDSHRYPSHNMRGCFEIPAKPNDLSTVSLIISSTQIKILKTNSFQSWSQLEKLKISLNENLSSIEPGAFHNLTQLWKLEISDNPNLSKFEDDTFIGLTNLRGLFVLRNNITHISDISRAFNKSYLPLLLHLDLTGNNILRIEEHDFLPLKGGYLYSLVVSLTKTEFIHPNALDPLGDTLHTIGFSDINVNETNMINFINRTNTVNPNLKYISMEQDLFCGFPRELMAVMANKTVGLSLARNHFGLLKPGYFPVMKKLKYLDLTDVTMDYLPAGVINSTVLPLLEHLYFGSNMFTRLTSSMVTPTLSRLIVSKDSLSLNNLDIDQSNSDFLIDDGVLKSMPRLEFLDLSGNKLNRITGSTFEDAVNLKVLLLKRTALTEICSKSFHKNSVLYYLDLSYNVFPLITSLTSDIFYGLDNLLALDLAHCNINQLGNSVFKYVPKLKYISLRGNPIFSLNPNTFKITPAIRVIDIRYNILVSWNQRIFNDSNCVLKLLLNYNNIYKLSPSMIEDFKRVHYVDLYANSISCDCDLFNNVHDLNINITKLSFINYTKCSYTTDANASLSTYLSRPQSECVSYKTAIIASSVVAALFLIFVFTILYFKYKYNVQYKFLLIKKKLGIVNTYRVKNRRSTSGVYMYDAFVSYSAHDSNFVEKMMMILEKDGSKFKLCIFERDFSPGDNLVDKILECMEVSMVTILVLTEAFAKSDWCKWEMSIAQNKVISQRFLKDCLILIIKSKIDDSLMTPTLRYLMDTRVYLEWHENSSIRQNIFWEKLKDSLTERIQKRQTQLKNEINDNIPPSNSTVRRRNFHETQA